MTRPLLLLLISLALSSPASATISESHGYAQFGTLKHPARFTHFDWANGLLNKNGQPLRFEILRVNPSLERILQPYVENLASIGVDARLRTVDRAQYKQCLDQFDFDMILMTLDQNLSPGLEQWQYFHSSQAGRRQGQQELRRGRQPGGRPPARNPAGGRALDRVLLWQHIMIPNWYLGYHRLAYRNRFAFVTTPPYTLGLSAWWMKASEKAQ